MDYQNYALQKFNELTEYATAGNCSVLIHEKGVLVDAGCGCPGGWGTAKLILEGLIGGRGQVGYTQRLVDNDLQIPATELFLDDPVGAAEHFSLDENGVFGVRAPVGYAMGVSLKGKEPALSVSGQLTAASETSFTAAILSSAMLIPRAVDRLRGAGIRDIQWAWSSCPVAPMCDDLQETERTRTAMTAQYGTVSIWVRGDEAVIRQALEGFEDFHLCVHELASAHTYRNHTYSQLT